MELPKLVKRKTAAKPIECAERIDGDHSGYPGGIPNPAQS